MTLIKNSVGIWAFGPAVTRFVPPGYHHELANEPMADKTRRACEGLSDVLEGLEYHHPAQTLQDVGYETQGGILGFDLNPYTEDRVGVVRGIDREDLGEAEVVRRRKEARTNRGGART